MAFRVADLNRKNNNKKVRRLDPHAGTKHSEIMKRRGVGVTVPMEDREPTPHGFTAGVFSGDFVVRHEVIGAGNNLGFGVNKKGDRVIRVSSGQLFVFVSDKENKGNKTILKIIAGRYFRAPKGLKYGLAASGTEDVELMVIESPNYADGWKLLEEGETREVSNVLAGVHPEEATSVESSQLIDVDLVETRTKRRRRTSKAKEQALSQARKNKKVSKVIPQAANGAGQRVGRNASTNANSATVVGVNPRPSGPPKEE